ncbi:hypothetical protein KQI68_06430 [Peptoniphilus sp. MSJ-1]|uniref:Uncharacterized protein n=1 Tax=Peptoniphilus ovalis TaxID=2841503 RepID=A0ABS6FH21_9FIRM|nr:hypothetical protein [Peptoniphilus ovalis]MBU5669473.1 hypothetical protein [Peptoniphilus ovalis]
MEIKKIGDVVEKYIGYHEGARFQIGEYGSTLTLLYKNPTKNEIEDISKGDIQYRITVVEDVIFLLFKFGSQSYIDCPYNINKNPDIILDELEDGLGYSCLIELIDCRNGKLKAFRFISFSTNFSQKLKQFVDEQREKYVTDDNIRAAFSKYSTNDLVKLSSARGKITRQNND